MTIDRPAYPECRLDKRSATWLWRRQAAWDLVNNEFDEVTEEEYDRAYDLLNRCIRYGLADARYSEDENDSRFFKNGLPLPAFKHRGELLDRRRERLDNELARYGAMLGWAGLYPTIIDKKRKENEHQFVKVCSLHYFD